MSRVVSEAMVEPVVRALVGSIDTGDGGTAEQRSVLAAIVAGYWQRPDIDLDAVVALEPDEAAAAVTDPAHRRRVRELMVLLEMCRHPLDEAQVARTDAYAAAMGESGPGLALARTLVREGAEQAMADYYRYIGDVQGEFEEPSLHAEYSGVLETPDPELAERLRALHDLPAGTLGYEYVEFYRRNGLTLPGDDVNMPAFFVEHDMCHVIAGYEPTGPEEIALSAMQLAISDTDARWIGLLGSLAVHEAGYFSKDGFIGKTGTLDREGAADLLSEALLRGSQCTDNFTVTDHLALADVPLSEVRARFGVPPRKS
jgi:hypothetical protein